MSANAATPPVSVSIITPCYNGSRFLADTLRSAAGQTRPPLEILVIDDGSTDDSAAIAEAFGPPVRLIRQANQGESVARNRGLAEARGSHVLFLDADDLLAPEAIERLAHALENRPGAVALMSCAWFDSDPGQPYFVKHARHEHFYPDIIEANIAPIHCWLAPRDVLQAAGAFCGTLRWFEDWDMWWRVGLLSPALIPVAYAGALYRQHPQSQLSTTAPANRGRGHAALVGRMAEELLHRPEMIARYGDRVYWSVWSALTHARTAGVPWRELSPLVTALRALSRRGPAAVRTLRSARAFRWLGVRAAFRLQMVRR